jgi:hypothetical protein
MPEYWPTIMGLAHIAGARTGFLLISNGQIHNYAASNEIGSESLKPSEVRQLLRGDLDPGRSRELIDEMRAAGLPA